MGERTPACDARRTAASTDGANSCAPDSARLLFAASLVTPLCSFSVKRTACAVGPDRSLPYWRFDHPCHPLFCLPPPTDLQLLCEAQGPAHRRPAVGAEEVRRPGGLLQAVVGASSSRCGSAALAHSQLEAATARQRRLGCPPSPSLPRCTPPPPMLALLACFRSRCCAARARMARIWQA